MAFPAMRSMSIDELLALPEDLLRHELLDGEHVVTPAPISLHQKCLQMLDHALYPLAVKHGGVEIYFSPADVILGPNSLLQPDLFVIDSPRLSRPRIWSPYPVPMLCIEILSPGTARRDRGIKREIYLRSGVEEYWIVDMDGERVERWRRGAVEAEILADRIEFGLSNGFAGVMDLGAVWRELG